MKSKTSFLITGLLFLLFAAFTAAVSCLDVQPIGPEGSSVGFAALNGLVFESLGVHLLWYRITGLLGKTALLAALGFAALGLAQLVRRGSVRKVDAQILLLGGIYVLLGASYLFFEKVIVNYRPVILEEGLEASYPSSHTMLVVCIMSTAMLALRGLLAERRSLRAAVNAVCVLMIVVTVVGRLVSGVHWFTDIVGGVLLVSALTMLYASALRAAEEKNGRR